jgi:hypothetical protein
VAAARASALACRRRALPRGRNGFYAVESDCNPSPTTQSAPAGLEAYGGNQAETGAREGIQPSGLLGNRLRSRAGRARPGGCLLTMFERSIRVYRPFLRRGLCRTSQTPQKSAGHEATTRGFWPRVADAVLPRKRAPDDPPIPVSSQGDSGALPVSRDYSRELAEPYRANRGMHNARDPRKKRPKCERPWTRRPGNLTPVSTTGIGSNRALRPWRRSAHVRAIGARLAPPCHRTQAAAQGACGAQASLASSAMRAAANNGHESSVPC